MGTIGCHYSDSDPCCTSWSMCGHAGLSHKCLILEGRVLFMGLADAVHNHGDCTLYLQPKIDLDWFYFSGTIISPRATRRSI